MAKTAEAIDYEEEAEKSPEDIEREQIFNAYCIQLAESRAEAIEGKSSSGIEREWIEDEEHYEGIDDANRSEMSAWASKPVGQADPRQSGEDDTGSTVFFNVTRPYCDAGAARMGDILLPTDDRNFAIKPTPLPKLVSIAAGNIPRRINKQIEEESQAAVSAAGSGNAQELADKTRVELVDQIKAEVGEALEKSGRAQERIDDWLVECQYHYEVRKVIQDAAKIGTGVLKGPIPRKRKNIAFMGGKLVQKDEIQPSSYRVSYWNLFPDPACGQSIHNGNFVFERDDITSKELGSLRGSPGYFNDQIEEVLREGPHEATKVFKGGEQSLEDQGLKRRKTKSLYEIWYYYGRLKKEDAESIGIEFDSEESSIDIQVAMVNNRIIKIVQSHLDTGEFPYDVMVWQERAGLPWGIGISRQIRTPQRIINAAARNLMDNAGLAGGPMWAVKSGILEPMDGVYNLAPRKGWRAAEDATDDQIKAAFQFFTVDMLQDDLQAIIQLGLKMAEDVTGLPMMLQGQQGAAPDTVGGMILMHNNASTVLRRIARLFDDLITEPHIRRYYRYLLIHGDDEEKGDFQIDARGSSALVERDIQNQSLIQMGAYVTNPIFKKDPAKWMDMLLKSQRINPKDLDYDDEQWQQIVEGLSQPPSDPRVEVQAMKIEHEQAMTQYREEMENQRLAASQELEVAFKAISAENEKLKEQGKQELSVAQIMAEMEKARDKIESDMMKSREKIDADLANTVMKLNTQRELSVLNASSKLSTNPPTEPAGRASPGMSYTQ